jgi:single-stranded DNA-binding protein
MRQPDAEVGTVQVNPLVVAQNRYQGNLQGNDQQGNKRYTTEVIVDEINFVDSKSEGPSRDFSPEPAPQTPAYSTAPQELTKFDEADEDDLPF